MASGRPPGPRASLSRKAHQECGERDKEDLCGTAIMLPQSSVDVIVDRKRKTTYLKGKLLGKGGFARCYLLTREDDPTKTCAGKIILKESLKSERAKRKLLSEIKIHRALSHTNIVGFKHCFEDDQYVYILLEYCNCQTLLELVKRKGRLSMTTTRFLLLQILDGVEYLQSHNIIHRDLKLGNIFLTGKYEVRIGDFGLAARLEHANERKKTVCGTPNYIAPEVLDNSAGHSFEVDIWSIGVILYTVVVGKPPFETKDVKKTYKLIQANTYSFPEHLSIPPEAKSLIRLILNKDPNMRPSLQRIRDHPFFNESEPIPLTLSSLSLNTTGKENQNGALNTKVANKSAKSKVTVFKCAEGSMPQGFVNRWVDHSTKYGMGYILNGGGMGVYFNDSSKLVISPNREDIQYYERGAQNPTEFSFTQFPDKLRKKVVLSQHFRQSLEKSWLIQGSVNSEAYSNGKIWPHVKKWIATDRAIFFRLNNKNIQVAFFEGQQLLLYSKERNVGYISESGEVENICITSGPSFPHIYEKLEYAREVLQRLVSRTQGRGNDKN